MKRERMIKSILRSLGAGVSYRGFEYTVYGLILVIENKNHLTCITKSLYPEIARRYHTTVGCVERDIRTVVEVIWRECDDILKEEIYGSVTSRRPTNGEFFTRMYEYIERRCMMQEREAACGVCQRTELGCVCELTGRICMQLLMKDRAIEESEKEKERLRETTEWMHEMIWQLLRKEKSWTAEEEAGQAADEETGQGADEETGQGSDKKSGQGSGEKISVDLKERLG